MFAKLHTYFKSKGRITIQKVAILSIFFAILKVVPPLLLSVPRPALWSQDCLISERDKYGANDITPGLTGWAQINGRDELEIPEKAELDGVYVQNYGFKMDAKCFLGSLHVFGKDDSVVEGGTGEIKKQEETHR